MANVAAAVDVSEHSSLSQGDREDIHQRQSPLHRENTHSFLPKDMSGGLEVSVTNCSMVKSNAAANYRGVKVM